MKAGYSMCKHFNVYEQELMVWALEKLTLVGCTEFTIPKPNIVILVALHPMVTDKMGEILMMTPKSDIQYYTMVI
jgi:hypothetical protein